jgi:hypothetical protein
MAHNPIRMSTPQHTFSNLAAPAADVVRVRWFYYAAVGLAIFIGHAFFINSLSVPLVHDSRGYYRLANEIWTNGLFSHFELSDLRTYGYPAVLGGLLRLADATGIGERWFVFVFQLLCHTGAAILLRRALFAAGVRGWISEAAFYAVLLNPFALIYPAYMLTESISLSLGVVAAAFAVRLYAPGRHLLWTAAAGGFVCGFMLEVRPANVFILPMWGLALGAILVRNRRFTRQVVLAWFVSFAAFVLPLLPQLRNNIVYYGKATPLIADPLSTRLQYFGILLSKYATSVEPDRDPRIMYDNPFVYDRALAASNPREWYLQYPVRGMGTFTLHAFNLIDQDLPLPYNRTPAPSYYPGVSIANFAIVGLALFGICVAYRRFREFSPVEQYLSVIAATMVASHLLLHSMFCVESRFGVAALIPIYASAAILCAFLARTHHRPLLIAATLTAGVVTVSGTSLSLWVRSYSPAIGAALAERPPLPLSAESNLPLDMASKWTFTNARLATDGEVVLVCDGKNISLIQYPVTVEKSARYQVDFEVRSPGSADALSVDLYNGPAYDHAEQNGIVREFRSSYQPVSFVWNSGTDAPPAAALRFATLSRVPVHVRNIRFARVAANDTEERQSPAGAMH